MHALSTQHILYVTYHVQVTPIHRLEVVNVLYKVIIRMGSAAARVVVTI